MKTIDIKSEKLVSLLDSIIELLYRENVIDQFNDWWKEKQDDMIPQYHPCSDEYLFEAQKLRLEDFAFPRALYGEEIPFSNLKEQVILEKRVRSLGRYLGSSVNALALVYPENGYMGWHHNGNAPGYNILFSYSLDGDGNFSFWDYETKTIKKIYDKPGWNVKVGYYPNQYDERDRVYWHMVQTKKRRVSIAFILENESVWKSMVEKISSE